mgnify:CR=1 FL=1
MYIERQQLVEELRLRKLIQQAIRIVESKKAITEDAVGDTRNAPYDSTGLNTLNTLFDNILTQLEDGYKELATGKDQRDSFAAHILTNIVNTLAPLRALRLPHFVLLMAQGKLAKILILILALMLLKTWKTSECPMKIKKGKISQFQAST